MRPIPTRIYTHLVTLWLAMSTGGIVLGIVVWQRLNQSIDASLHGASFRVALQNVSRTLAESEAAAHAYCLSGDKAQLDVFRGDERRFGDRFNELTEVGLTHPDVREDLLELRSLAALHFKTLGDEIALREQDGLQAVAGRFSSNGMADLGERIRQTVHRLEQYPEGLLTKHSDAARYELQRALSTTLAAGLFGLGAGVLAFYLSRVALRQEMQKRELSEHALRAERSAQDKSTFLANMSHEIRTPMNAILGFSELLVAELPGAGRSRQHARSIHDAAQSLLQLINDILDLSKIEASMLELHLDPTDVRELRSFLQTVFGQQATRKGLRLEFVIDPELPAALLVDRSRLRQVLVNLVGNAVKFTESGSVTLKILWQLNPDTRSSGTLTFEVVDTGIGIPPEKQAQIFEPFVQVDTRRPFEQQGTGLGLSIVQRLTERMGGAIEVDSMIGVGSTFRIRLPDVSISARLPVAEALSTDEIVDFNDLAPSDILVVDDNSVNRNLLGSTFEGTHHRVRFATNGREAIEQVRAAVPDIVLMDIRMPEMDGPTALAEIRKLPGAELLPVIAVTASSMVDDEHRYRGNFAGYLRKPFTRPMLYREMAYFLPKHVAKSREAAQPAKAAVLRSSPAEWPALVSQLRKLQRDTWPNVRDGGAIPDAKNFAAKLRDLGRTRECPPLQEYADALLNDAENFAVHELEKQISRFPAVVEQIAERAQSAAAAETAAPTLPA